MLIQILSDLHLEHSDFKITDCLNKHHTDVLILAGDITQVSYLTSPYTQSLRPSLNTVRFFDKISAEFPQVLYVMGNHEHYRGDIAETKGKLQSFLSNYNNIRLLENDSVDYYVSDDEKITFLGCTLWTDYGYNPLAELTALSGMVDYEAIKKNGSTLYTNDLLLTHQDSRQFIEQELKTINNKVVVITHHAPSSLSINDRYRGQLLNNAFYSNLDSIMLENEHLELWIHGHMHNSFDYTIGKTRVLCNPKGYPRELNKQFDPYLTVEIDI